MNFKAGQKVTMFIKYSGHITKQPHVIDEIVGSVVKLEDTIREFNLDGKWIDFQSTFGTDYWIEVTE